MVCMRGREVRIGSHIAQAALEVGDVPELLTLPSEC